MSGKTSSSLKQRKEIYLPLYTLVLLLTPSAARQNTPKMAVAPYTPPIQSKILMALWCHLYAMALIYSLPFQIC